MDNRSPENRGSTTVPPSVVARIAEQAATEVAHVGGAAGGVLGMGARREFSSRPSAECELYGHTAVLRFDIGLVFPVDLRATLQKLRDHIRQRVEYLTGLQVGRIDIEVSWLNAGDRVRGELR